jgi:putative acetyltransferase
VARRETIIMNYNLRSATNTDKTKIENLVFSVLAEYGLKSDPECTDSDLSNIQLSYIDKGGSFDVLVDENDNIQGTVGLYRINETTCEIRKMYLSSSLRGQGLGKKLLTHALSKAKELGYTRVELETASVLKEAIGLYKRYGFRQFMRDHLAARCDASYYVEI